MKKWIIIGVTIAVVVAALIGAVGYFVFRESKSRPDVVKSLTPCPNDGQVSHAAWSPDGQRILYESWSSESWGTWVVDLHGQNQVYLGEVDHPVWSPEGSKIAFVSDDGLEVVNADGGGRRLLVGLAEVELPESSDKRIDSAAWSPDGSMVAFEAGAFIPDPSDAWEKTGTLISGIWVVDADGSDLRRLATDLAESFGSSWSPDGGSIAFVSRSNDDWDIYVADVVSGGLRQLTASSAVESELSWSPDGKSIALVSRSGDASDIYVADVVSGGLQQLTTSPANDLEPCWSPDGSKIAFVSGYTPGKDEDYEIWVMDADGNNRAQIMKGSESCESPAWSPDGAMIAFSSRRFGPLGDIWIMNADGTGKTRLTKTSTTWSTTGFTCTSKSICYREPQWSPDGTKLVFLNSLNRGNVSWWSDRLWVLELNLEKLE